MTNTTTTYTATAPDGTTFKRNSKSTSYEWAVLTFTSKEQNTQRMQEKINYYANEMVRPDQSGGNKVTIDDAFRLRASQAYAEWVARLNTVSADWSLQGFRSSYKQAVNEKNKVSSWGCYAEIIIVQAVK